MADLIDLGYDLIDLEAPGSRTPEAMGPSLRTVHRKNADVLADQWSTTAGRRLGVDEESLEWVSGYLSRLGERGSATERNRPGMLVAFASFLGECFVRIYGGRWAMLGDRRVVVLPGAWAVDPYRKVGAQLDEPVLSIHSFFTAVPVLMRSIRALPPPADGTPRFIRTDGAMGYVPRRATGAPEPGAGEVER